MFANSQNQYSVNQYGGFSIYQYQKITLKQFISRMPRTKQKNLIAMTNSGIDWFNKDIDRYEPKPLQDHNQYSSRNTINKSPNCYTNNDDYSYLKTKSKIEELQGIISELQAGRIDYNRKTPEKVQRPSQPFHFHNYEQEKNVKYHIHQLNQKTLNAYKTECPSRTHSQNRQVTPQQATSLSPISFRGLGRNTPEDYSTNHPNNQETWQTPQPASTSQFASPIQTYIGTKQLQEKSRMLTPPLIEEQIIQGEPKFSDLFTRYISTNANGRQSVIRPTSPKFNGVEEQTTKFNRPSVSPLQKKTSSINNPYPQQLRTETTDFTLQLNQFLNLHREHPINQEEEKSMGQPAGQIIQQRPSIGTLKQTYNSNVDKVGNRVPSENLVCFAMTGTQNLKLNTHSNNSPIPQRTTIPNNSSAKSKIENSQQQQSIVSSVLPDSLIINNLDNFQLGKVLGLGSYAVVRIAVNQNGQKMAIKTYEKTKLQDPQKRKNVTREMKILSKLRHPNIIRLYQASETSTQLHLIMEYTSSNSLNTFIKSKTSRRLVEDEARFIFRQILDSIKYCHHKNVVHRDIKLENILVDDKRCIKLIDFGFSIAIDPATKLNVFCGTPSYMAPEIVNKIQYSFAADIWALGILLFKMLTGVFPFRGQDDKELYKKINSGKIEFPNTVQLSPPVRQMVQKLLRVNQADRPTAKEILNDDWFSTKTLLFDDEQKL